MRRFLAVVAAVALVGLNAETAGLHVHHYGDHAHPEHQHGLAAHDHHQEANVAPLASTEPQIRECDAAEHVFSLQRCTASPTPSRALALESVHLGSLVRPQTAVGIPPLIDVRVHGPPRYADGPLRAPPASIPA